MLRFFQITCIYFFVNTIHSQITPLFPNAKTAAEIITRDTVDSFFERLNIHDLKLQLKSNEESDKEELLRKYVKHLRSNIAEFHDSEKLDIHRHFIDINMRLKKLDFDLDSLEVSFVKMNNNTYGSTAFYTRNNAIIIPAEQSSYLSTDKFKKILCHEIWHILSRNHKENIDKVYEVIGFYKAGHDLNISDKLKSKILLNPDGMTSNWIIKLPYSNDSILCTPIISSTCAQTNRGEAFFECLKFELFQVNADSIVTNELAESSLSPEIYQSLYSRIGRNTNYIIHPDEICADLFAMIVLGEKGKTGYDQRILDEFTNAVKSLVNYNNK